MRLLLTLCFFFPLLLLAQMPLGMQFQAVVRDQDNLLQLNQNLDLRMDLLQTGAEEQVLYREFHTAMTNDNGLVYVSFGQGTMPEGQLSDIDWRQSGLVIRCYAAAVGSTDFFLVQELPLATLPYAFHTAIADSIYGYDPGIPDGTLPGDLLVWQDSNWTVLPIGQAGARLVVTDAGSLQWDASRITGTDSAWVAALEQAIDLVAITGGTYERGCQEGSLSVEICSPDEFPVQQIAVNDFSIGRKEVTQDIWTAVMGFNPAAVVCGECPVTNITWYEVRLFLQRLNRLTGKQYRLPTETEWEYAAKRGIRAVPADDPLDLDEVAVYKSNSSRVQKTGSKDPDLLGLYDMRGNVWEWVSDWYQGNAYAKDPIRYPEGPVQGQRKSIRGCAFNSFAGTCLVSNRDAVNPDFRQANLGFRIAAGTH